MFYFILCVIVVLSTFDFSFIVVFGLSSACYDVVLFIILLCCFIYVGPIQIDKTYLISRIYQIMIVIMLNN